MSAEVTIDAKIPAIKHGYGQRDAPESYATSLQVKLGSGQRIRILDHEFMLEDLLEAVTILRQHSALRT